MKRILGVTLAVLFAVPFTVSAEEVTGKIKAVDRAGQSFVLEDGTRLSVDEGRLADLREGDKVQATYATKDGMNVVTELDRRTIMDGAETSNFGGAGSPFSGNSIEAGE
jgi:hypothetical protein